MARASFWRSLWETTPLRGGLGRRILWWFLVLSLVPLLLSNSVGFVVSRRIIEQQIERYLRALAEIQAQQVATEIERHLLFMDGVSSSGHPIFREILGVALSRTHQQAVPSAAAVQADLEHELEELRSLTELFVMDTAGVVIAATDASRQGQDWSLSQLFRRGRAEHFFEADWGERDGRVVPLYRLAVPIRNGQQRLTGVLAGVVAVDTMRAFLRLPEHPVRDAHAFIVDHRGLPVFFSHPHSPVDYRQPFPSPLVREAPGSIARYINYEGTEVIGISVAVSGVPWRLISEVSVASALGQLRGLALLAAALESVFALLLVAAVWTVAQSIVSPLRGLVVAAERIRKGDPDVAVGFERDDELGDLGRTFNQMSRELQASAAEIQELHAHEMRRAAQLASVGEMASGIAHEIKNPLIGVASGVDLLSKRIEKDPKSVALLDQIDVQIRRIESAIRDLLSYATPNDPHFTRTEPWQLVDRLITLVRPQADAAGVRITQSNGERLPTIRVDPELMTQALVNLALNAIQAMEPGGSLRISVASEDGAVRFSVSDTGEGIEPDELERIFRPFYTTKHKGTGLGLAITRAIVERHGGHIATESELNEGSTFTLIIPAESQEALVR